MEKSSVIWSVDTNILHKKPVVEFYIEEINMKIDLTLQDSSIIYGWYIGKSLSLRKVNALKSLPKDKRRELAVKVLNNNDYYWTLDLFLFRTTKYPYINWKLKPFNGFINMYKVLKKEVWKTSISLVELKDFIKDDLLWNSLEEEVWELMAFENVAWLENIDDLLEFEFYYELEPKEWTKYLSLTWEQLVRDVLELNASNIINWVIVKEFFNKINRTELIDYFYVKDDYKYKRKK